MFKPPRERIMKAGPSMGKGWVKSIQLSIIFPLSFKKAHHRKWLLIYNQENNLCSFFGVFILCVCVGALDHWCVHPASGGDHGARSESGLQRRPHWQDPDPDQSGHRRTRGSNIQRGPKWCFNHPTLLTCSPFWTGLTMFDFEVVWFNYRMNKKKKYLSQVFQLL